MIRVPITIKTLGQARNTPIYDQVPCYNQSFSDDQPPFYSSYQQQQFDCCEVCGGPRYSSDCQTRNQLVYEPNPARENNRIWEEILRTQMPNLAVVPKEPEGSDDYTEVTYDKEKCLSDHYTALVTPPAYTPSIPFLATMEPADTFLMGDEVISTILERENDEFIKSSVDDLVPIPRDSEVTSVYDDLERRIDFNPRDIETNDLIPVPWVFDEPLGNSDSVPRSYDVTFSNPLFDFNDDYTLCYDNPLFDEEFEDIKIPSGESKVHIEVLSVLWGNRLSIPDGSLPLSRTPDVPVFKKVEKITEVEIRLLALSVRTADVSVV
ncbi:hypothetical protein Tco_1007061 [Tanacetum coccineum]|uniref:Uncharacterized protein n=1 Tax=Tanacetum coccineum TaxID=301880 RepID=A0ABQ5FKW3_9ASTR